jgi:hypothetical protein
MQYWNSEMDKSLEIYQSFILSFQLTGFENCKRDVDRTEEIYPSLDMLIYEMLQGDLTPSTHHLYFLPFPDQKCSNLLCVGFSYH